MVAEYAAETPLQRRSGESEFDYHRRLIYGKLQDKTLADYDYTELSECVYGKKYAPDVARRLMYGSRFTLELMDKERIAAVNSQNGKDGVLRELDDKLVEIEKEKRRLFDQRREFNKVVSAIGRGEHLEQKLVEAANLLNETVGIMFNGNRNISQSYSFENNEAVLVFSDWHYGMVAKNIFNTYNIDICKERVRSVVKAAEERLLLHRCGKLHIIILGDMFHGAIHTSARVASEELACDQLMQVSEIIAQAVCELSAYTGETHVYMTYGNHCRTVQNKNDSLHRDNMERIIPWWLRERLSSVSCITVENESDNEFLYLDVCGHGILAAHGDLDSVKGSPRFLSTLFQKTQRRDVEYIILGDKHHREGFEEIGVTAELCGSLCGADDYANDRRLYSTPMQLMLIVNPDIGVDAEYKIVCRG